MADEIKNEEVTDDEQKREEFKKLMRKARRKEQVKTIGLGILTGACYAVVAVCGAVIGGTMMVNRFGTLPELVEACSKLDNIHDELCGHGTSTE